MTFGDFTCECGCGIVCSGENEMGYEYHVQYGDEHGMYTQHSRIDGRWFRVDRNLPNRTFDNLDDFLDILLAEAYDEAARIHFQNEWDGLQGMVGDQPCRIDWEYYWG